MWFACGEVEEAAGRAELRLRTRADADSTSMQVRPEIDVTLTCCGTNDSFYSRAVGQLFLQLTGLFI